jgi:ketosteroid isomerase-like protein
VRGATLALLVAGCAAVTPLSEAPRSLAAAETAFAAHSVREDMRAAFIAHFAPGGVFIRDGWTDARAYLEPRPAPRIVLDWKPVYVETAASGDIGLSTGPWKLTSKDKPDSPPAHGQFVSIWQREGTGPWRVVADLGISHPAADLWDRALEARTVPRTERPAEDIAAAERRFAREMRERGPRAAYAANAADNLRVYRNGSPPSERREAGIGLVDEGARQATWIVESVETARTGDFGYARGRYALGGEEVSGYFLRAWRAEHGRWRLLLDVLNPVPRKPS